jgi:hypothetical protein
MVFRVNNSANLRTGMHSQIWTKLYSPGIAYYIQSLQAAYWISGIVRSMLLCWENFHHSTNPLLWKTYALINLDTLTQKMSLIYEEFPSLVLAHAEIYSTSQVFSIST